MPCEKGLPSVTRKLDVLTSPLSHPHSRLCSVSRRAEIVGTDIAGICAGIHVLVIGLRKMLMECEAGGGCIAAYLCLSDAGHIVHGSAMCCNTSDWHDQDLLRCPAFTCTAAALLATWTGSTNYIQALLLLLPLLLPYSLVHLLQLPRLITQCIRPMLRGPFYVLTFLDGWGHPVEVSLQSRLGAHPAHIVGGPSVVRAVG